jgi:hypothetical protein
MELLAQLDKASEINSPTRHLNKPIAFPLFNRENAASRLWLVVGNSRYYNAKPVPIPLLLASPQMYGISVASNLEAIRKEFLNCGIAYGRCVT